jgi:DNA (cytosine-5)-methyltransferase 1
MLGEGLRAGLKYLGIQTRTICHIEREAYAAAVMAARSEEGSMDPAPLWSDLLTFDAAAWYDAVDCIVAGFPCQDLSLAGRRAGLDGKRSGLFFDILDIADACGAGSLFLENVAGIASATASVVDEESTSEYVGNYHAKGFSQVGVEDGRLLERAAARVVGELADRGWDAEWHTISASDVGASHGRARWFCLAWRRLGHPGLQHQHLQQREDGAEHPAAGEPMANPERADRGPECVGGTGRIQGNDRCRREEDCRAGVADEALGNTQRPRWPQAGRGSEEHAGRESEQGCCGVANPTGNGRHQGRPEPSGEQGRSDASECGCTVADTSSKRSETWLSGLDSRHEGDAGLAIDRGDGSPRPLFAPGPTDPSWPAILERWPELAPAIDKATEPGLCGVADGLASGAHDSRAARLRCGGNGVVALQAAVAVVRLLRRAGMNQPNESEKWET